MARPALSARQNDWRRNDEATGEGFRQKMNGLLPLLTGLLALTGLAFSVLFLWKSRNAQRRYKEAAAALAASELQVASLQAQFESQSQLLKKTSGDRDLLGGVLDHLPQPVWVRAPDFSLKYCNLAYAQAIGRHREEALAGDEPLVEQIDRAAAHDLAVKAQDSGNAQSASFHVVFAGKRHLIEITKQPVADGSLISYARDMTELEQAQRDLDRRKEVELSILERVGFGIAILNPGMRLSFFNQAYARIWGFDEDFLNSRPHLSEMLSWLRDHRLLPEQADYAAFRRQRLSKLETLMEPEEESHYLPDGRSLRATLHPNPFGGVIQIFEDVSDRLQLERTYNTLVAVQRATLDSLHEGVAVFGSDGRLQLCNPAYAQIWGLRPPWLDEKPHVREVAERCRHLVDVSDEEWPDLREAVVAMTTERESRRGRIERSDGRIIDWRQMPLPDGNCVFSYVDATASARTATALRERNEALETADRLKSEFIANISYELRTPLNAIIGFSELLQQEYSGTLNEGQQEYVSSILTSAEQLASLIDDMIDLASIEAGYMELDPAEVDIREMLRALDKLWRSRAESRNLTLILSCPEDIGTIWCDERRLRQALFNLLSNAFRFTPDYGVIELSAERQDGELLLRVSDNGIGIPLDEQEAVLGRATLNRMARGRRRRLGAGVGLILAKSLVELHGGWLEFDSRVNSGTTATCHLPTDRQLLEAPAKTDQVPAAAGVEMQAKSG